MGFSESPEFLLFSDTKIIFLSHQGVTKSSLEYLLLLCCRFPEFFSINKNAPFLLDFAKLISRCFHSILIFSGLRKGTEIYFTYPESS